MTGRRQERLAEQIKEEVSMIIAGEVEDPRVGYVTTPTSINLYCGPVLRHPAKLMLPAVDLGGQVWLGGKPCKGGPAAPAFGG